MNKYISPEYGKEILSDLFTEVLTRDYSKINKDKYPSWGITVMGYSELHKNIISELSI